MAQNLIRAMNPRAFHSLGFRGLRQYYEKTSFPLTLRAGFSSANATFDLNEEDPTISSRDISKEEPQLCNLKSNGNNEADLVATLQRLLLSDTAKHTDVKPSVDKVEESLQPAIAKAKDYEEDDFSELGVPLQSSENMDPEVPLKNMPVNGKEKSTESVSKAENSEHHKIVTANNSFLKSDFLKNVGNKIQDRIHVKGARNIQLPVSNSFTKLQRQSKIDASVFQKSMKQVNQLPQSQHKDDAPVFQKSTKQVNKPPQTQHKDEEPVFHKSTKQVSQLPQTQSKVDASVFQKSTSQTNQLSFLPRGKRWVCIEFVPQGVSLSQIREALSVHGDIMGSFFQKGSGIMSCYIEYKTLESKERALASRWISVNGKQLSIRRVDRPVTTVVRLANVSAETTMATIRSVCKSHGKLEGIFTTKTGLVDVHYSVHERDHMPKILGKLNEVSLDGTHWIASPAPKLPPVLAKTTEGQVWAGEELNHHIKGIKKHIKSLRVILEDMEELHSSIMHLKGMEELPIYHSR